MRLCPPVFLRRARDGEILIMRNLPTVASQYYVASTERDDEGTLIDDALLNEIREINLSYLVLTQQMARTDKAEAMLRLGVSKEIIEVLAMLSSAQLVRLAAANVLLCRFRFDDHAILSALTHGARREESGNLQAVMLLAQQPVEEMQ